MKIPQHNHNQNEEYNSNQMLTIAKQGNNQSMVEQGNKMWALVELKSEDQASAGILKDTGCTLYYAARTGAQGLVTMVFFDTAANAIMQYSVVIGLSGGPVGITSQVVSVLAPYILSNPHVALASTTLASFGLYPENIINTGKYLANTFSDIFAGKKSSNSDCKELVVISAVKQDVKSDDSKDVDGIIAEFTELGSNNVFRVEFVERTQAESWTEWFSGFIWTEPEPSSQEMQCMGNRVEEIKEEDSVQ